MTYASNVGYCTQKHLLDTVEGEQKSAVPSGFGRLQLRRRLVWVIFPGLRRANFVQFIWSIIAFDDENYLANDANDATSEKTNNPSNQSVWDCSSNRNC